MRLALLASTALLLNVCAATAQVTTCMGDVCTVEENGVTRTLSPDEVGKIKRANARTAIENIECRWAAVPATCEGVLKTLHRLFPF